LPIYAGKYASGWKELIGATGGVVIVRMVCVVNTPGVFMVHLGIKPEDGGRAASAAEYIFRRAWTLRLPW